LVRPDPARNSARIARKKPQWKTKRGVILLTISILRPLMCNGRDEPTACSRSSENAGIEPYSSAAYKATVWAGNALNLTAAARGRIAGRAKNTHQAGTAAGQSWF